MTSTNNQVPLACLSKVKRNNSNIRPQNPTYIDAEFIGDRSGSMYSMGDAPKDGVRNFILKNKKLFEETGSKIHITIRCFDDFVEIPYSGFIENITEDDIEKCCQTMVPRNTTRLFDTVLEAIDSQKERIQSQECTAVLSLFTDGEDNVSENTFKEMSKAIKEHRLRGVNCQFLAANQDAIGTGRKYGFDERLSIQVTPDRQHATQAFEACTDNIMRCATDGDDSGFSQLERLASATHDDRTRYSTTALPSLSLSPSPLPNISHNPTVTFMD